MCSHYSNSCVHGADMNTMKKSAKGTQNLRMHIVTKGKIASDLTFKRIALPTLVLYTPHDIIRAWCQKSSKLVCGCWMSPHHCSKKQQCRQLKRGFAVYGFSPDRNWLHFFPLFCAENNHEIWVYLWNRLEFKARRTFVQRITKNSNCILVQNHFWGFWAAWHYCHLFFFCIQQGVLYCRELTSILARHPEIYNPPFANLLQCRFYLQVSFLLLECFAIMVTAAALCIFTALHDHNCVYYIAVIPSQQVKFVFMASHF